MKPVPEDIDAERALLTTLCAQGADLALASLLPRLQAADFMHPAHRAVFAAIQAVSKTRRQEVNSLTLGAEMESAGTIAQAGGRAGLIDILSGDEVGKPAVLVDILAGHRRRRELIRLGEVIRRNGEDLLADPDEAIHEAQAELARIARDGTPDDGESWMEILHQMAAFEPFRQGSSERGGFWGIPTLDQVAPIPVAEYTVVGARPGVGKTLVLTQIALASSRAGMRPLIVSLELSKASMRARIASHLTGVSISDLKRGDYHERAVHDMGQQAGFLELGRIQAPVARTPWPKLEAMIRREVDRYGCNLVLLDQFDKVGRPEIKRGSSEAYAFGEVSTSILGLTQELAIGFVLACQLKGDAEGREPTLADHADSDRPGKDGAVVVHFWRNRDGDLRGKIQKNRDGAHVGHRLDLQLQGHCQRIVEVERDTRPDQRAQAAGESVYQ